MSLEKIAKTTIIAVRLREEIPVSELQPDLFRYPEHHNIFLTKEVQGKPTVFVHIVANGINGAVEVVGVSAEPDGYEKGRAYDGIGRGAIQFLLPRMDEINSHLPNYSPARDGLYAISTGAGGVIEADSRKS